MEHADMTRDPVGTHSHMASSQLLRHAPLDAHPTASWQVPGADITRLLALSRSFELQGELTPVQAWYKLRQDPRFARVSQQQLEKLRQLLWKDVKCYG